MNDAFWSAKDLAGAVGLTDSHVRRLLGSGAIPGAFKKAGAWWVPHDDALAWVKEYMTGALARSVKRARSEAESAGGAESGT